MATTQRKKKSKRGDEFQGPELRRRVIRREKRRNLGTLWSEIKKPAQVVCWGIGATCPEVKDRINLMSAITAGKKITPELGLAGAADELLEILATSPSNPAVLAEAIAWTYALPKLAAASDEAFPENAWWRIVDELQLVHRHAIESTRDSSIAHLMAGAELGLAISWCLADIPSCAALHQSSTQALKRWLDASGESVGEAVVAGGKWIRLVLGSGLRARRLASRFRVRIGVRKCGVLVDLAGWACAATRTNGSAMLQPHVRDAFDTGPQGLLNIATDDLGAKSLRRALDASLNRIKSDGRLAWRVELPEPGWYDNDAALGVMLPEWDVRRGRLAVDHSGDTIKIEVSGGRAPIIQGQWTAALTYDGELLEPTGPWNELCWYSDDDVHYLEVEQPFESGLKIQRQLLLIRDDRCVMLADAVLGGEAEKEIHLKSQVQLANGISVEEDAEMQELRLVDSKSRALVLPLALGEWKSGPQAGKFYAESTSKQETDDSLDSAQETSWLSMELRGDKALYQPLWIDLIRKRTRKPFTWRRLTVGQQRRLVPPGEANAFRVHAGNDQWVVYRSMTGPANRTFLGKNLISDFYCGRFDSDDGSLEELISVDEQPE